MGTVNHRVERLRRHAEQAVARYQQLPGWKRQVLARFLMESQHGWHTRVHVELPAVPAKQPDLLLIGPKGVLTVLLLDEPPDAEEARPAFRFASDLFLGARVRGSPVCESVVRPVIVLPPGERARGGDFLAVPASELDRVLERGERRLDSRDAHQLVELIDARTADYIAVDVEKPHEDDHEDEEVSELFDAAQLHHTGSIGHWTAHSNRG